MSTEDVLAARKVCPRAFEALDAEADLSEEQFARLEDALTVAVFSGRVARQPLPQPMESDMVRQQRELDRARWEAVARERMAQQEERTTRDFRNMTARSEAERRRRAEMDAAERERNSVASEDLARMRAQMRARAPKAVSADAD